MAISCYLCTGWVYGADGNRDCGIATEQNRGREERIWRVRRTGERISRRMVDAKAPDSQALVARRDSLRTAIHGHSNLGIPLAEVKYQAGANAQIILPVVRPVVEARVVAIGFDGAQRDAFAKLKLQPAAGNRGKRIGTAETGTGRRNATPGVRCVRCHERLCLAQSLPGLQRATIHEQLARGN